MAVSTDDVRPSVRPAHSSIAPVQARTHACQGMDGTRPCVRFAEVMLNRVRFCRAHAVERLNLEHQAAVETVHRTARDAP